MVSKCSDVNGNDDLFVPMMIGKSTEEGKGGEKEEQKKKTPKKVMTMIAIPSVISLVAMFVMGIGLMHLANNEKNNGFVHSTSQGYVSEETIEWIGVTLEQSLLEFQHF